MIAFTRPLSCIALATGLSLATSVHAEEFRLQLQVSRDTSMPDGNVTPDIDATALSGVYYFEPVLTDGVPVPEASFVARNSYLGAAITRAEFGGAHGDSVQVNLGYHLPDSMWFGRVGMVHDDAPGAGSDTSWNGTLGIVPRERLHLGTDFTSDDYDPNITVRYAGKLPNARWYSMSVHASDPDQGDTEVGFQADYYLDGIAFGGGMSTGGDRWNVRVDKGLPHGFGLLIRYYADDLGDGVGAMLTWRDLR